MRVNDCRSPRAYLIKCRAIDINFANLSLRNPAYAPELSEEWLERKMGETASFNDPEVHDIFTPNNSPGELFKRGELFFKNDRWQGNYSRGGFNRGIRYMLLQRN